MDKRTFIYQTSMAAAAWASMPRLYANGQNVPSPALSKEDTMDILKVPAHYYQQFDADFSLEVPGEGYRGWLKEEIDLSWEHTALVVMHAWDAGTREEYPGWHRAVEYIPRSYEICKNIFPRLLGTVRNSGLRLIHVVGGGDYYKNLPGHQRVCALAGEPPPGPEQIQTDERLAALRAFRSQHVFVGSHNQEDVKKGFENLDFPDEARPRDDEDIAENGHQLLAVCKAHGVNHLIYVGFAINWCLLLSPGGMAEMSRHGILCSTIRQATTAVENKETARKETCKSVALWRVALAFGFVFDMDDVMGALKKRSKKDTTPCSEGEEDLH